jgi:hypothetical protein
MRLAAVARSISPTGNRMVKKLENRRRTSASSETVEK